MSRQRLEKALKHERLRKGVNWWRTRREHQFLKSEEWIRRLSMQRWLVPLVTWLVVAWLIFVGAVVILDGMAILDYHPSVLAALLGSATASIVGLLLKVVSYTLPELEWG